MLNFGVVISLDPKLSDQVDRILTVIETAQVDTSALLAELSKLRQSTTALKSTVDANK